MKFGFVTIKVKNMEESLKFYEEVLKLKELAKFSPQVGINIVFLKDEDNNKIELIEFENTPLAAPEQNSSLVSIGFKVESLDSSIAMLKEKGINILRGPVETPGGAKFIYFEDPNGVEIELIEGFNM